MTYTERLQRLADFLKSLPDEKFCMDSWSNDCGSVACAVGWACTLPEFNALGLKSIDHHPFYHEPGRLHQEWGFDAAQKFFGLTPYMTLKLFKTTHREPTPMNIALIIEQYLNGQLQDITSR